MGNSSSSNGATSSSTRNSNSGTAGNSSSLSSTLTGAATNISSRITGGGSNNNSTSLQIPSIQLPTSFAPFRGTGSLGLTKAELDARCQPSGLYPSCEWDPKQIRRLIGDGRLAARLKGSDSRTTKSDRECPICFMLYSQSNVTKCCEATICTECYLQIRTPKKEKNTACPFCNCPKLVTSVQKSMDEDAIAKREEDEQRVIESMIRNRAAQVNGEMPASPSSESDEQSNFGSSLEQYNRSRTFSNSSTVASEASSDGSRTPVKQNNDDNALLSLAMSPDARLQLEEEMAAQLSHETHQRMESEAEEERMRHAEEWSMSDSGVRSRMREARITELTNMLERMTSDTRQRGQDLSGLLSALENGRGGNRSTALENMMRLEAAFLNATGEERTRQSFRRGLSERLGNVDRQNGFTLSSPRRVVRAMPRRGVSTTHMETAEMLMRGISEEEQLAMAISMSMAEESNRQQQQSNEEHQDGQQTQIQLESDEGDHAQPVALETNESESDSSSSSDSSHTDTNANEASTPSLADGEEQVVFETE